MIYLASPYSHIDPAVRLQRFETVCFVAANLMKEGHHIFSPIAHTHPICLKLDLPFAFEFWKSLDEEMITFCSDFWIVRMDGWSISKGVAAETAFAVKLGKSIRYI